MARRRGLAENDSAGLTSGEGRRFALTVGVAFLALGGLLAWRGKLLIAGGSVSIGLVLIVAGIVIPARLGPVHRAWMTLAQLLSKVTTPVIMGVLYFVVVTPSGLLLRTFSRNPIKRRRDTSSFWVLRKTGHSDLTRQF